jgi:hypothetical protein
VAAPFQSGLSVRRARVHMVLDIRDIGAAAPESHVWATRARPDQRLTNDMRQPNVNKRGQT